jgi:NOL1/NOP2/sun family putative RNA methylase
MQLPQEFPPVLAKRLAQLLPTGLTLETSFGEKSSTTIRVNTIKNSAEKLIYLLEKQGCICTPVSWYADAYTITAGGEKLTQTAEFSAGRFYIQNLSSMLPSLILDPQPGENILDLAAAPGSKTTQLATLMKNTGTILANDVSRSRIFRLKANIQQQGVTNTQVSSGAGEYLWQQYPEYFDRVLLDAPCSMEGRIKLDEPETFSDWSLAKVKQLARKQQFLLRSAFSATKPGGVLVYSTCTLSPEENEGVVNWLLEKEGDAVELLPLNLTDVPHVPGVESWENKQYHPRVTASARVLPKGTFEGFFVAKIRKTRPTVALL